jgi:hypothetical protein
MDQNLDSNEALGEFNLVRAGSMGNKNVIQGVQAPWMNKPLLK